MKKEGRRTDEFRRRRRSPSVTLSDENLRYSFWAKRYANADSSFAFCLLCASEEAATAAAAVEAGASGLGDVAVSAAVVAGAGN